MLIAPMVICVYKVVFALPRAGRKTRVHRYGVGVPHLFLLSWRVMSELSIFIDESGDFGEYQPIAPYYIVTMVFHDQSKDINDCLVSLEHELAYLGYPQHCLHAGPIIRMESEFKYEDIVVRRKILMKMMGFVRKTKIKFKSFYIEKRNVEDITDATGKLSKQIGEWVKNNYEMLLSYDIVKIYYDNGQVELSRILASVFNVLLPSVVTKKVVPSDYRLFQAADFICTMKLSELKLEKHTLSIQEQRFFGGEDGLSKNYLKDLKKYEFE